MLKSALVATKFEALTKFALTHVDDRPKNHHDRRRVPLLVASSKA